MSVGVPGTFICVSGIKNKSINNGDSFYTCYNVPQWQEEEEGLKGCGSRGLKKNWSLIVLNITKDHFPRSKCNALT